MADEVVNEFPLFPLGLVALPTEAVPLHIFEQRYRTMIGQCIDSESEFGIVWMSDDGLRDIGCACEVEQVLEEMDDGRFNVLTRGTRPFRVLERQGHLAYPGGRRRVPRRRRGGADDEALEAGPRRSTPTSSSARPTVSPSTSELDELDAYAMAATVDFGLDAKQGLLELRSENARLTLVTRLFRAATKRLDFVDRAQTRARSNGKVRFS